MSESFPTLPASATAQRLTAPSSAVAQATREAIVLPLLFLTVSLAGGFRSGPEGAIQLLAPPLISLVLAVVLLGVLVRGAVLVPTMVMNGDRALLDNLSGAVVLMTLVTASAQVFNLVTPEAGLLHVLFNLFYFVLLWNTVAASPDSRRLLRSLLVVFGGAFVLKFIVLAALYSPGTGFAKRVLTILLEGVTLGALDYELHAPLTGYIAFFTIAMYMVGLFLLPGRAASDLQR